MAVLAETQQALHDRLMEVAPTPSPELLAAWQVATGDSLRRAGAEAAMTKFAWPKSEFERDGEKPIQLSEQFLVLITCRDEK